MSLWHVDMKTEGVNGKLLLLALTYDSSDMGTMLPWECEAQCVLRQCWTTFLALRIPGGLPWHPFNLELLCSTDIPIVRVGMRVFSPLYDYPVISHNSPGP